MEGRLDAAATTRSAFQGRGRLVVATLVDSVGTGLFVPFMIVFFLHTTTLPLAVIGACLSAAALAALPAPLLVGVLVDRFGAQLLVGTGNLVSAAAFLGYLFIGSAWQLVAAAFVASLGQAMFWTATRALVGVIALSDERASWFALQTRARNAGYGIGGVIGAVAVSAGGRWGYLAVAAANAGSYLVAAALVLSWRAPAGEVAQVNASATHEPSRKEAHQHPRSTYRHLVHDRPLLVIAGVNLVFVLCSSVLTVLLAVYLITALHAPVWLAGGLFTLDTVLVVAAQGDTTRSVSRYRRGNVLTAAACCFGASFVLLFALAMVPRWLVVPAATIAMIVFTLAEMLEGPLINAVIVDMAPVEAAGRYLAAYQVLSWSLGSALAPAMLTWLLTLDAGLPWVVLIALCAVAAGAIRLLPTPRSSPHDRGFEVVVPVRSGDPVAGQ